MNKSESAAALDESAEPRVLDCHHNDITQEVTIGRRQALLLRKMNAASRYARHHGHRHAKMKLNTPLLKIELTVFPWRISAKFADGTSIGVPDAEGWSTAHA